MLFNEVEDERDGEGNTSSLDSEVVGDHNHHCHSYNHQPVRIPAPQQQEQQESLLHDAERRLEEGKRRDETEVLETRLRHENMVTCRTLHRLDERTDRQTRFLLSIDATACSVSALSTSHRLAEFCRLLNRIFISTQERESSVTWNLDDPHKTPPKVGITPFLEGSLRHNAFPYLVSLPKLFA